MDNKPNAFSVFLGELTKDSFRWLLVFLFSVGFVGGVSFFLFDWPNKIMSLSLAKIENETRKAEMESDQKALMIADGWFGDPNNLKTLDALESQLGAINVNRDLPPQWQAFLDWSDKALDTLNIERRKISEYEVIENTSRPLQEILLAGYGEVIIYITLERNTIKSWPMDSPDKRLANVRAISAQRLKFSNLTTTLPSRYSKVLLETARQSSDYDIQNAQLTVRTWLATLGICGGCLAFGIFGFGIPILRTLSSISKGKTNAT